MRPGHASAEMGEGEIGALDHGDVVGGDWIGDDRLGRERRVCLAVVDSHGRPADRADTRGVLTSSATDKHHGQGCDGDREQAERYEDGEHRRTDHDIVVGSRPDRHCRRQQELQYVSAVSVDVRTLGMPARASQRDTASDAL